MFPISLSNIYTPSLRSAGFFRVLLLLIFSELMVGEAGLEPVGIICPTGEIPAKTGEKVTNFLEKNAPKYEII
jgi:hypothetical protein